MKKHTLTKSALNTRRIATCSVLSALSVVFMLIGAVTEVLDLTMMMLASLCIVFAVIEIGVSWAFLVWGVTAFLSFLLFPTAPAAIIYFLGGAYPIAKSFFERHRPVVAWILKIVLFNALQLLFILIAQKVLGLTGAGYEFAIAEMLLGNAVFILYDICLTTCITMYLVRLRRRLKVKSLRDKTE